MSEEKGNRVLITGATDGIGLLMAQRFSKLGWEVLATGRQPLAKPEKVFGDASVTYIRADQSYPRQAAQSIDRVMTELDWKTCDLVVLNAGIGWTGNPVDEQASDISEQIMVNLSAPVQISHILAPRLLAGNGHLVFIGSTAHKGAKSFATYAATKGALKGFARSLREEWRDRVRVQVIHPGPVKTAMHSKAGLKLGLSRLMFTKPRRAANAIMSAILRGEEEVTVSHLSSAVSGWWAPRGLRK